MLFLTLAWETQSISCYFDYSNVFFFGFVFTSAAYQQYIKSRTVMPETKGSNKHLTSPAQT